VPGAYGGGWLACGCASGSGGAPAAPWLVAVLGGVLLRRRRGEA